MQLPDQMTAVEITAPGEPGVLKPAQRNMPKVGPDEVLIEVAAAGVNRPDVLQRRGMYEPPLGTTDIPGLEIAGTVVAVGNHVKRWKRGDRVCALVAGGGYAEYCTAPEGQCLPVPEGFSMIEAACVPETFFTVWTNVFQRGRLRQGETLLVHGGSSRYRHDGDPARESVRGEGVRDRRLGRQVQGLPKTSEPTAPSTTRPRISSKSSPRTPAARASTWSSTWSAATISRAASRSCPSRAGT